MFTKLKDNLRNPRKKMSTIVGIFLFVILTIIPLGLASQRYLLLLMCLAGIYIIASSGLDLSYGYSGQISLGQAGFYAIGAYTSAMLSLYLKIPVALSIIVGTLAAALVGYLLAFTAVKLVHHFLSLTTIAFGEIVRLLLINGKSITGGPDGLIGVPSLSILGVLFSSNQMYFYIIWICVILVLAGKVSIIDSRVGRAFIAVRDNPVASEAFGIKLSKYKAQAFAMSALCAGLGGALYAHLANFINPDSFTAEVSDMLLVMVLIGGSGTFWGPIVGSVIIIMVNEYLQVFTDYRMAIYGIMIIVVLFFLPKGIIGTLKVKLSDGGIKGRKKVKA